MIICIDKTKQLNIKVIQAYIDDTCKIFYFGIFSFRIYLCKKNIMEKSIHQKRYHTMIALLRGKREAVGMTQIQLAEKLNISQTVVSKIETCERRLDVIELKDVCDAINVSFMDFFNELNSKL